MFKEDFPIFSNNQELIYLDSASTSQKPGYVIDRTNDFLKTSYANIHRGMYDLSERSEKLYLQSKKKIAGWLGCLSSEIIYSYNATHSANIVAQSLVNSGYIKKGDTILVGVRDHHASIVPWQLLSEQFGFFVRFVDIKSDYSIDRKDFEKKYTENVSVVCFGAVSNVSGYIYDLTRVRSFLRSDTFFVVDGSQALPHFVPDLQSIEPDALFFTAHKMLAYTGLGVLYMKKNWLKKLTPMMGGGGIIEEVSKKGCTLVNGSEKFESGTPNIVSAVSFLYAMEYIESIGGYSAFTSYEQELVEYTYTKLKERELQYDAFTLVAARPDKNVGVFSFSIEGIHPMDVNDTFAEEGIAIRCGGHCAHPFLAAVNKKSLCRISLYLYSSKQDIDGFLNVLDKLLK